MNVPQLTRALVLQKPEAAPDGAGGHVISWISMGTLWAEIRASGRGVERLADTGPEGVQRLRITVRAAPIESNARPRPGHRLVESGHRRFRILSVAESDPKGRYLVCSAIEEDPA